MSVISNKKTPVQISSPFDYKSEEKDVDEHYNRSEYSNYMKTEKSEPTSEATNYAHVLERQ